MRNAIAIAMTYTLEVVSNHLYARKTRQHPTSVEYENANQTIHVYAQNSLSHSIRLLFMVFSARGYDLVWCVRDSMFMAIQNVPGFRNSMHRSCILLFSHKFSATSKIVPFSVCLFVFFYGHSAWTSSMPTRRHTFKALHSQFVGETKWWIYLCDNNVGNKIIGLCALSELTLNEAIKHQ